MKTFAIAALAMASSYAAMLPGSEPKEWPADPARHVVKVERVSKNESDAALITAAESAAIDTTALLEQVKITQPDAALVAKQWWIREEMMVKIPFAITTDAILYYSTLVTDFGKQKLKRYSQPASHFHYSATVEKHESFDCDGKTFRAVSVVTLSMDFSESFVTSVTEALSFKKQRIVVFDAAGKILHCSGDGETEVPIMAI